MRRSKSTLILKVTIGGCVRELRRIMKACNFQTDFNAVGADIVQVPDGGEAVLGSKRVTKLQTKYKRNENKPNQNRERL